MNPGRNDRTRWLWAACSVALTLLILHGQRLSDRLEESRRAGRVWQEGLAAWEAEENRALAAWEARQVLVDELLPAPRGVGHVTFLEGSSLRGPRGGPGAPSPFAFSSFRAAAAHVREGRFLEALEAYRRCLEREDPQLRVRGVPLFLIAWLRTVECLAHVDARISMLVSIDLGVRALMKRPLALDAAEAALAVRVLDRILRRNDEAAPRMDISADALRSVRSRAGEAYEGLRMLVRALRNREAWERSLECHVQGLSQRLGLFEQRRYGFLSFVGGAPILNVIRRLGDRTLLYSFDPSEVLGPLEGKVGRGGVFSVTFDKVLLASRSVDQLEGRSRRYAANDLLAGLNLHVFFPADESVPRPEGAILSPARRPPSIEGAALDLAEAMYEELGKGNLPLARERYGLAMAVFPPADRRRRRAREGFDRCSRSSR